MQKTKIEWADMTWNPVTGCLHDCPYCYAKRQTQRFGGYWMQCRGENLIQDDGKLHELGTPKLYECKNGDLHNASYPYVFSPTFHRYRLDEPAKKKNPQNIFVCSMADLFGEWVPDKWIEEVFEACEKAPQHRYLFLTKNPKRLIDLNRNNILPLTKNFWFGTTITSDGYFFSGDRNIFLSIEPIMSEFGDCENITKNFIQWVIIGAETGNRKGKIIPQKEWIERIVYTCLEYEIPIFMKNSLKDIWGEPLIQEYPWKGK